ncbi:MAG: hypothetical protein ACYTAF_06155 [Planctomycetota bacterium]|jgi:hypothetical protein
MKTIMAMVLGAIIGAGVTLAAVILFAPADAEGSGGAARAPAKPPGLLRQLEEVDRLQRDCDSLRRRVEQSGK